MDKYILSLAEKLRLSNKDIVVGISGHGGAGKTTFAKKLLMSLNNEAQYLNTDVYIANREIRHNSVMTYEYEGITHSFKTTASHPSAHHIPALERDIYMIKQKKSFYTIDTPYEPSREIAARHPISIIEGMSVSFCNPELFDLLIYIHCDGETEFNRRSVRDVNERGVTLTYLNQTQVQRRIQYELFMHHYRTRFHIIINTSNDDLVIEESSCVND